MTGDVELPEAAREALSAWHAARRGAGLPPIEFAATELDPDLLDWSLCYRRVTPDRFVYSLIGEALGAALPDDPKGETALAAAPEGVRAFRYGVLNAAIDQGRAFWVRGAAEMSDARVPEIGRLGLPATNGDRQIVFMTYYFLDGREPGEGTRFTRFFRWSDETLAWL